MQLYHEGIICVLVARHLAIPGEIFRVLSGMEFAGVSLWKHKASLTTIRTFHHIYLWDIVLSTTQTVSVHINEHTVTPMERGRVAILSCMDTGTSPRTRHISHKISSTVKHNKVMQLDD